MNGFGLRINKPFCPHGFSMNNRGNNQIKFANPGLTLLELLVVLTILIAIGGIVVSSFPGLLSRTQTATAAANVPEIDSAIRRGMIAHQGQVGNRFDSLIAGGSSVADFVGGNESFIAGSLSDSDVAALGRLGIFDLTPALESTENATFDGHGQLPQPIGSDTKVCQLSAEYAAIALERMWNLIPRDNVRYILFGIGPKCSLVGGGQQAVFKEAPVHFSDDSLSNPKNMYARYLVVIELDNTIEQSRTKARYVGVAIPHRTGIMGINDQLADFYSGQQ